MSEAGMAMLNWVDFALIGLVALSAVISLVRGFLREAMALVGWVAAVWIVVTFTEPASAAFADHLSVPSVRMGVTALALFVSTMIGFGILVYLIGALIDKTGLSGTDRLLGVVFGAARGVVIAAVVVILAGLTSAPKEPWWSQSQLLPHFEQVALRLRALLPEEMSRYIDFSRSAGMLPPAAPVLNRKASG